MHKLMLLATGTTGLFAATSVSAASIINPLVGQSGDIESSGLLVANFGALPADNTWNRVGAVGSDARAFVEDQGSYFSNQIGTNTLAINTRGTGIWNNTGVDIMTIGVGYRLELDLLVGWRNQSGIVDADALYEIGVINGSVFSSLVSGNFEDTTDDLLLNKAPTISYTVQGTETGLITVHIRQNPDGIDGSGDRVYVDGVRLESVPEPGAMLVGSAGMIGLCLRRRRRVD